MTPTELKTILGEYYNWQGTQTGRFSITDKDTLLAAFANAVYAYDEAVEEERATARNFSADLKAITEVWERERKLTAQKRSAADLAQQSAYEVYRVARKSYEDTLEALRLGFLGGADD